MALRFCLIALCALALAAPVWAQSGVSEQSAAPVQVAVADYPTMPPAPCPVVWPERRSEFALYGWLSGIDADVTAGPITRPIEVGFSDILSNLDMVFMGYYETAWGKRGVFLDAIYLRLSGEESFPDARLDWQVTQWLAEAGFVFYGGTPERGIDRFVGLQYVSLDNELGLSPQGVRGSQTLSQTRVMVGSRYRTAFSPKWSATARWELGLSSNWQVLATARYRLNEKTYLGVGYRYLHLNLEEGDFGFDGAVSGPLVGIGWEL